MIPTPKINSVIIKFEQEEQPSLPVVDIVKFDPIHVLIITIETNQEETLLHSPIVHTIKENLSIIQTDKVRDPDILGELQYYEEYNEVGATGMLYEYFPPLCNEVAIEQLHTPIVATIKTKVTALF